MSLTVHSQFVKRGQLHSAVDLYGEVARGLADRQQVVSRYHDLALRDQNAVDGSAIDDGCDAAAHISADHRVHNVSRQADNVRVTRFCVDHSHFENTSPQKVTGNSTTTVPYRTQDFRLTGTIRFRAASCPVPIQGTRNQPSRWHNSHSAFVGDSSPGDTDGRCTHSPLLSCVAAVDHFCCTRCTNQIASNTPANIDTGTMSNSHSADIGVSS